MNKRKVEKLLAKIGTGVAFLGVSFGAAYFLTPNSKRTIDMGQKKGEVASSDSLLPDHFMRFVSRLNEDTGIMEDQVDEENTYYGFNINFDDFSVSFKKDEYSAENKIGVAGDIDLTLRTIKNIAFNVDVDVDYNGRHVPVELGYMNKTAYFGLYDLRMKVGSTTIDELLGNEEAGTESLLYQIFMASKEEGGINFDLGTLLDDVYDDLIENKLGALITNIDMSSLADSFSLEPLEDGQKGVGLNVIETEVESGWKFTLDIQIRTDSLDTELNLGLFVDQDYRLTRVELGTIDLGNVVIKGSLNINAIKNYSIIAPDKPEYRNYNPAYNYVEVINYKGWLQKLANFIDEDNQKFAIDFALDLAQKETTNVVEIGSIEGAINADFSKILNFSKYMGGDPNNDVTINSFRNNASLGLDLHLFGQGHTEYSNLSISYVEGQGFLKLNEMEDEFGVKRSVVRSKIETETMNWLIDEMPGMFANISGDGSSSSIVEGLFSFVTDSTLVRGIKDGDYSVVLDVLKNVKNTEKTVEIDLDLSTLGFGDNAEVSLVLDSEVAANHKVLNLDINNIEMGSFILNAEINTNDFEAIVVDDPLTYDSLDFLPTVFDQIYNIVDTKQTGFSISGSMLDEDGLGIALSGKGQLDIGAKYGFGDLTIDQYKYKNKGVWYSHKIAMDVDNTTDDYSQNNAHFVYGDKNGKNIKGKVTIQSVLDIVDVFMTFLEDNKDNEKWTKFLDPIEKMLSIGELGAIINQKDYFRLLKNDLVKSCKRNDNQLDMVIGGALFDFDNDMTVRVNLEDGKLSSLELIDFQFSNSSTKKLNVTIALEEFEEGRESSVDKSDLNSFMDLSSIAVLLKFGIKTTENNYYHLGADINIDFGTLEVGVFDFHIEVYVVVQDSYCKIYGVIEDAKISSIAQDYNFLTAESIKSEFTFETYPDGDPNREDGVGGYFHFKISEKRNWLGGNKTDIKHYKTTSKNLLESDNILEYLLRDFLNVRKMYLNMIGGIDLSSGEEKDAGDFTNTFTDTGFKYTESEKKWSVGINLNELIGIDALKELDINIYGNADEKFSRLKGRLYIKAISLIKLGIDFDIKLEDAASSVSDWSSSIQSKFSAINNVVFPEAKLNDPTAYINS